MRSLMLNTVVGGLIGMGLPLSYSRRGFGSKVSTCDGPPSMNRKITDFAFGVWWGVRGLSGLTAAEAFLSASRYESARPPKPLAHLASISRRLERRGLSCMRCMIRCLPNEYK